MQLQVKMAEGVGNEFKFLYRILRADEQPDQTGIIAVSPFARVGVQRHVLHGTSTKTKFISTGASLEGILKFAKKTKTKPARIAVIDHKTLNAVENVSIINLNDQAMQRLHLKTERAIQFVENTKEVLIVGSIPPRCVLYVAEKSCRYQFLYRLLRTSEQPVSDEIRPKDVRSNVPIEDYILKGTSLATQFIATCASSEAVERFAKNATNAEKSVAKIDARMLVEARQAIFIDLTDDDNSSRYLKTKTGKTVVKQFEVVLIVGRIPKHCIASVSAVIC